MLEAILSDLKYAHRALRKNAGFSILVVITLALGIGANTTIFTVVHGVLMQPLPYAAPDRLAVIWNDLGQGAQSLPAVHPLDYRDYQDKSQLFEEFAAASGDVITGLTGVLTGEGEPERIDLSPVSANFFSLFGVDPVLGRHFEPEEEVANGPKVAMISHGLWQRRFGGDPDLVGRTIQIHHIDHTVVGILPDGFRLLLPPEAFLLKHSDVWTPLQVDYGQMTAEELHVFLCLRSIEASSHLRAGASGDGRHRSASQGRARCARIVRPEDSRGASSLRRGQEHATRAGGTSRGGGARFAHRLCQRGEPTLGARHGERERVRDSVRSGCEPVSHDRETLNPNRTIIHDASASSILSKSV